MQATFTITPDVSRGLLRISMGGFFEAADIARFAAAVVDGLHRLQTPPNGHLTLVDIREMDIQSSQSVVAFQRILTNPATAAPLIAFVETKSLAAMQIRRAASSRPARYFDAPEAAEAWLLSAGAAAPRRSVG